MRIRRAGLIAGITLVFGLTSISAISSRVSPRSSGASGYHVAKTIPIGGDGPWDYCIVDSAARRVYISQFTHVVVLNADTDAIFYDAASKRVFAFNGKSKNATAIEAEGGKVAGMVEVGGKPEFAAGDGGGHVFVNIEDKSELVEIDALKLVVLHRWPLAPCKEPSGLAMDKKNRRLFAVCDNNIMAVVNADSGKEVATPAIVDGPDASEFDPEVQFAFSSNGGS